MAEVPAFPGPPREPDAGPASALAGAALTAAGLRAYLRRRGPASVPARCREVLEVLEDEQDYIRDLPEIDAEEVEPEEKRPVRLLAEEERAALLQGLDAKRVQMLRCLERDLERSEEEKWKAKVREHYEAEILQIDRDIGKLSQRYIFVASDG